MAGETICRSAGPGRSEACDQCLEGVASCSCAESKSTRGPRTTVRRARGPSASARKSYRSHAAGDARSDDIDQRKISLGCGCYIFVDEADGYSGREAANCNAGLRRQKAFTPSAGDRHDGACRAARSAAERIVAVAGSSSSRGRISIEQPQDKPAGSRMTRAGTNTLPGPWLRRIHVPERTAAGRGSTRSTGREIIER